MLEYGVFFEEFSEGVFSYKDQDENAQDSEFHLLEDLVGFEVVEAGHEEIGGYGHGDEPDNKPGEVGFQEILELGLGPPDKEEDHEVRGGDELGYDNELRHVLFEVVGVELDPLVVFELSAQLPPEPGVADGAPDEVPDGFHAGQDSERGQDKLRPGDAALYDQKRGKENGQFSL